MPEAHSDEPVDTVKVATLFKSECRVSVEILRLFLSEKEGSQTRLLRLKQFSTCCSVLLLYRVKTERGVVSNG